MTIKAIIAVVTLVIGAGVFLRLISPQSAPLEPKQVSGWVRYVVDGDSLYLGKYKPQIRLWGVDAPEKNKRGFEAASNELAKIAQGQFVKCWIMDTDKYGRTVARCFLKDGREVNRMMIESGTAKEYMKFSKGFYNE